MINRRFTLISGFLDQAVVSAASFLTLIVAAQGLHPSELGRFALAVGTVAFALSVVRALTGESALAEQDSARRSEPRRFLLGAGMPLVAVCALVCILVALVVPAVRPLYLSIAFALVGVLLQDLIRYCMIDTGDSVKLLATDGAVAVLQIGGVFTTGLLTHTAWVSVIAYGSAPAIGGVITLVALRIPVDRRAGWSWMRANFHRSSAYAFESLLGAAIGYLTLLFIAGFASTSAVAAFRATVSVYGLTSLVVNFVRSTYMRHLSRQGEITWRVIRRVYLGLTALNASAILFVAACLYLIPDAIGGHLLGPTWAAVTGLAIAGAVNRLLASLSVIPTVLLRVLGVTWQAVRARIVIAVVSLGLGPVGAIVAGAYGALVAESVTYLAIVVSLTALLPGAMRRRARD